MVFGQVVVGPPGAGKSTYCAGVAQYLELTGRAVAVVNLDPAADAPRYAAAVDVGDLVTLAAVQRDLGLGPNGGLVYCMEYLEANLDWLLERLAPLEAAGAYVLFDVPGQVELFSLHGALRRVLDALAKRRGYRLVVAQLVDAHLCADAPKYLSAALLSLTTMLHLELPQVNFLSKCDALARYGDLPLGANFFLEAADLARLSAAMAASGLPPAMVDLSRELGAVIDDFGLLSFQPLAIEDRAAVAAAVALADKANGYVWAGLAADGAPPPELQYGASLLAGGAQEMWEHLAARYGGDADGGGDGGESKDGGSSGDGAGDGGGSGDEAGGRPDPPP